MPATTMLRCLYVVALVLATSVGCNTLAQQTKTNANATCGSSCKSLPPESQSDCIVQCAK